MKPILVFVEITAGAPRRASLEALGAARATGAETVAVFCGEASAAAACNGAQKAIALGGDSSSPDALASSTNARYLSIDEREELLMCTMCRA